MLIFILVEIMITAIIEIAKTKDANMPNSGTITPSSISISIDSVLSDAVVHWSSRER